MRKNHPRKWTVVIEINDYGKIIDGQIPEHPEYLDQYGIRELIAIRDCPDYISYAICEAINAPYGPEGVFLDERQMPKK
jgi:hypothetical protein